MRAIGTIEPRQLAELLEHSSEHVRWWAVAWSAEDGGNSAALVQRAKRDSSPLVLLGLASAVHRLPVARRWPLVTALAERAEISGDKDIPLVVWYALAPAVAENPQRAVELLSTARVPLLRQFLSRRLADAGEMPALAELLARHESQAVLADVTSGALRALRGRRNLGVPGAWPSAYQRLAECDQPSVRRQAELIALVLGDAAAERSLRDRALNDAAAAEERRGAVRALVEGRVNGLAPLLHKLVADAQLREVALQGLAALSDPATPNVVIKHYANFTSAEKQAAIATLAARKASAEKLLATVEAGKLPRGDISAYAARQIEAHRDQELTATLRRVWGDLRSVSQERRQRIAEWKQRLGKERLAQADLERGRAVFRKTCTGCHRLYGEGAQVGPDLTGSNRDNLDYLLENIFDPSAAVARDYRVKNLLLDDGRLVSGLILEESERTVTVATATEQLVIDRGDIDSMRDSPLSMMPDGLLLNLPADDVRDLIGYLMHRR